ncbi:hypothetical protein T03_9034 [Trichinella britovi]|uniref:Uncharacterized protein n=1 Tax=Trichinella britovi TaxID=45882 RepID=A0A0V1CL81_TRIBR|nr:hypothetical protein T03_9034 [Trichinella britovi]KRZ96546.1 hypothetical protein T08_1718 [Trichinella sp. T8]
MDNFAPAYHELTIHWPQNTVISFFSSLRCLNNFLKASTKSMPLKLIKSLNYIPNERQLKGSKNSFN